MSVHLETVLCIGGISRNIHFLTNYGHYDLQKAGAYPKVYNMYPQVQKMRINWLPSPQSCLEKACFSFPPEVH